MSLTIAETATALNLHQRVYSKNINSQLRQGLVLENRMAPVQADRVYTEPNVSVTDVIQAFQCQFTPKGDAVFNAVDNWLQPMKVDIQFSCADLEAFRNSWMAEWVEDGKSRTEWSLPRYIYEEVIMPKIIEELELKISYKGSYLAPTPGTPGLTINAVDGLGKKIADAITASLLTPIVTGALTPSTMLNQVEAMLDAIPVPFRDLPGDVLMSPTRARQYWRDYRSEFGTGNGVSGNQNLDLRVDATNKVIVPIPAMEGSDRIIVVPKGALIVGYKKGTPRLPQIRWQESDRVLKGLAEFDRFYGVRYWGNIFVNDQA